MKVLYKNNMKVPAKIWTDELYNVESGALDQVELVCSQPYVKRFAGMPDIHLGKGCTIGSVIGTSNALVPNFVGVDIGCGMTKLSTIFPVDSLDKELIKKIIHQIKRDIPMGMNVRKSDRVIANLPWWKNKHNIHPELLKYPNHNDLALQSDWYKYLEKVLPKKLFEKLTDRLQRANLYIGTLGGGNHFIELQRNNTAGHLDVMLHSGSRGPGEAIASAFMYVAEELNKKWQSNVAKGMEFLPDDSLEGQMYLNAVTWAQDFAMYNRYAMIQDIINVFDTILESNKTGRIINIHHNYVNRENHGGENLWVHRKGATRVRSNIIGLIPGSMGTASYVVTGTNNEDSMDSCSHGAGRRMGRNAAKANLSMEDFKSQMSDIISNDINQAHLDESPNAYKDIEEVMRNQADLVNILVKLTPIANCKG